MFSSIIFDFLVFSPSLTSSAQFTPWAVRSLDSCVAIPAWAFGRRFAGGRAVETCPEFPLGVLLGMFGSAFCASIEEMESNIGHQSPLLFKMLRGLDAVRLVAPTRHYNPAFGIGGHAADAGDAVSATSASSSTALPPPPSAIAHKPTIELIDAGCCVNAPLPPLLRPERALDVVFVLDARPTDFDANDSKDVLRKWEAFARAKGQRAPRAVAYAGIGARSFTVIEDDEQRASGAPTLVYMPLVRSEVVHADFDPAAQGGWAAFDAFTYSEEHFDVLLGLACHNFVENERAIRELLWTISERKRERRVAAEAASGAGHIDASS